MIEDLEYGFVIKPNANSRSSRYVAEFTGSAPYWDDEQADAISNNVIE